MKGDAGDAMQGRWNCSDGCDARRCGARWFVLYKYWLREATGIAPPEANCLRRDEAYSRGSSSPFCWRWANGEEEAGGTRERWGGQKNWAADRTPASEAPARPTPASAQRLLVGSGWAGSGLGSGLGGGLAAKWAFDVVLGIGLSGNGIDGLLQACGNTGRGLRGQRCRRQAVLGLELPRSWQ